MSAWEKIVILSRSIKIDNLAKGGISYLISCTPCTSPELVFRETKLC